MAGNLAENLAGNLAGRIVSANFKLPARYLMTIVSVEDFRTFVLPIVTVGAAGRTLDNKALKTCLVADSLIHANSRWTRFPRGLGASIKDNEEAFQGLWNDVIECAMKLYPDTIMPLVQFAVRPTSSPVCIIELKESTADSLPMSPDNPRWFWEKTISVVEFENSV